MPKARKRDPLDLKHPALSSTRPKSGKPARLPRVHSGEREGRAPDEALLPEMPKRNTAGEHLGAGYQMPTRD
jgi:hypothetical protein